MPKTQEKGVFDDFKVALFVSGSVFLLPYFFALLSKYVEVYELARHRNYVNMFRSFMVCITALVVLMVNYFGDGKPTKCWEKKFGQEMYRLTIMFPFFMIFLPLLLEFATHQLYKLPQLKALIVQPEFDIGLNTTYLIFGQNVMWLGIYFSPLLPAISSFILWLTFYVRRFSLTFNQSTYNPWRAASTPSILLGCTFITQLGTLMAFFVVIGRWGCTQRVSIQ